ncbi:hypothetical protein A2642_05030 [Candidatus Nomurabacteria bacterium RIFCSPHIGHO2_01_FULL_39_10]|uniref:Uncharacterized protein n=1 Tax=Candidatus Nomurabacteria bacterium RIFCSPHIGHO2_01_FULL_39_10 TaxID=1801733 RepID=A0A1F6V8R2_9BACT|nr:MAG: hypothetical protein A2642_05030 [Candidatus Nomurabacteria bacterium RIFCSPHIGHO2_01_FULL_39_10]
MDTLTELNWSEITRSFLAEKIKRALLLKKLDKMLENSQLTEQDCLKLGEIAKKSIFKKHLAKSW